MNAAVHPTISVHTLWQITKSDRSRQAITLTAAVAQVVLPTVWGPRFAGDEQPPNVIQPAPYTFAIWLPIFASSLGFAALQTRGGRRDSAELGGIGWPLAAAFASTGLWAPLVRTGKYWSAQAALAAVAGFAEIARRRVARARPPATDQALHAVSTVTAGTLAAWGVTATGVNLASMLAANGLIPAGVRRSGAAVGLLLGLGAAGAAATRSTGDSPVSKVYAATLIWGLTGVVVGQRRRSPAAAGAASAAIIPIVFAAARRPAP